MMQTPRHNRFALVPAAALAAVLLAAPSAFAYPPGDDHPAVGPAGVEKATEVGVAGVADGLVRQLLRPNHADASDIPVVVPHRPMHPRLP